MFLFSAAPFNVDLIMKITIMMTNITKPTNFTIFEILSGHV